jgi:hypothetical protein
LCAAEAASAARTPDVSIKKCLAERNGCSSKHTFFLSLSLFGREVILLWSSNNFAHPQKVGWFVSRARQVNLSSRGRKKKRKALFRRRRRVKNFILGFEQHSHAVRPPTPQPQKQRNFFNFLFFSWQASRKKVGRFSPTAAAAAFEYMFSTRSRSLNLLFTSGSLDTSRPQQQQRFKLLITLSARARRVSFCAFVIAISPQNLLTRAAPLIPVRRKIGNLSASRGHHVAYTACIPPGWMNGHTRNPNAKFYCLQTLGKLKKYLALKYKCSLLTFYGIFARKVCLKMVIVVSKSGVNKTLGIGTYWNAGKIKFFAQAF